MQNGIFEIGLIGTLTDFFSTIKTKFLEYTNFELLESTDLSLTFDTKIYDVVLKITDTKISDTSSTSTSNSLKFEFLKNNISISNLSVSYSQSSTALDTSVIRKINLFTHSNNNLIFYAFLNYSATIVTMNNIFGSITSKALSDDTITNRFIIGNNFYNVDTLTSFTVQNLFSGNSTGIVMINLILSNSSIYTDYVPNMYNCSKVIENKYYNINNKKYYSLTANILIEE